MRQISGPYLSLHPRVAEDLGPGLNLGCKPLCTRCLAQTEKIQIAPEMIRATGVFVGNSWEIRLKLTFGWESRDIPSVLRLTVLHVKAARLVCLRTWRAV